MGLPSIPLAAFGQRQVENALVAVGYSDADAVTFSLGQLYWIRARDNPLTSVYPAAPFSISSDEDGEPCLAKAGSNDEYRRSQRNKFDQS